MRWLVRIFPFLVASASACNADHFADQGDASPNDASQNDAPFDSAASDGAKGDAVASNGCPSKAGPSMVRVTGTGADFCIDSTEVTVSQYVAFVQDVEATGDIPVALMKYAFCSGTTQFAPNPQPDGGGGNDDPVLNVGWCEAVGYCAWAGKRLCGSIADGTTILSNGPPDWKVSEWSYACTHGGVQVFPYGNTFSNGACNVTSDAGSQVAAVKSFKGCTGGFSGIYDMVGNANEWVNAWSDDAGSYLGLGGGSWADDGRSGCNYDHGTDKVTALGGESHTGFRCCATPQ